MKKVVVVDVIESLVYKGCARWKFYRIFNHASNESTENW
mgnify:CR=1 FL=1